jgi:hypothetical protein
MLDAMTWRRPDATDTKKGSFRKEPPAPKQDRAHTPATDVPRDMPDCHGKSSPTRPQTTGTDNTDKAHTGPPVQSDDTPPSPTWPPDPETLMAAIRKLLDWKPTKQSPMIFRLDSTPEAAAHNSAILKAANYDLQRLIADNGNCSMAPGAEFRPVELLEHVFAGHPCWPQVKEMLTDGAKFPLRKQTPEEQQSELRNIMDYGNHKSAQKGAAIVLDKLEDEIKKGWQIPITTDSLHEIPDAAVGPVGLADQLTIDEKGNVIPTKRLTHDQSYDVNKKSSVNHRVDFDKLPKIRYGHALRRFCAVILAKRRRRPNVRLLMCKYDIKSAYRRMTAHPETSFSTIITTKGLMDDEKAIALLSLRLAFGGAPAPAMFGNFSKLMCDLCNVISRCPLWEPLTTTTNYEHLLQAPKYEADDVPFGQPLPTLVEPPVDDHPQTEVYVDDFFNVFEALSQHHIDVGTKAIPLMIDLLGRPPSSNDAVYRDWLLSLKKAMAEGRPQEVLIILGWLINSRRLTISLPYDKYVAWRRELRAVMANPTQNVRENVLDRITCRLNHITTILPVTKHMMSNIRSALSRAWTHRHT